MSLFFIPLPLYYNSSSKEDILKQQINILNSDIINMGQHPEQYIETLNEKVTSLFTKYSKNKKEKDYQKLITFLKVKIYFPEAVTQGETIKELKQEQIKTIEEQLFQGRTAKSPQKEHNLLNRNSFFAGIISLDWLNELNQLLRAKRKEKLCLKKTLAQNKKELFKYKKTSKVIAREKIPPHTKQLIISVKKAIEDITTNITLIFKLRKDNLPKVVMSIGEDILRDLEVYTPLTTVDHIVIIVSNALKTSEKNYTTFTKLKKISSASLKQLTLEASKLLQNEIENKIVCQSTIAAFLVFYKYTIDQFDASDISELDENLHWIKNVSKHTLQLAIHRLAVIKEKGRLPSDLEEILPSIMQEIQPSEKPHYVALLSYNPSSSLKPLS